MKDFVTKKWISLRKYKKRRFDTALPKLQSVLFFFKDMRSSFSDLRFTITIQTGCTQLPFERHAAVKSREVKKETKHGEWNILINKSIRREQRPAKRIVFVFLVYHMCVTKINKTCNIHRGAATNMREGDNIIALMVAKSTYHCTSNRNAEPRGFFVAINYGCTADLLYLRQSQKKKNQMLCQCSEGIPALCENPGIMTFIEVFIQSKKKWMAPSRFSACTSAWLEPLQKCEHWHFVRSHQLSLRSGVRQLVRM